MLGDMNGAGRSPTLDEIRRTWPAAVGVPQAAAAFGLSRSHAYELIACGEFPARVLQVGSRYRVVTASILAALSYPDPDVGAGVRQRRRRQ